MTNMPAKVLYPPLEATNSTIDEDSQNAPVMSEQLEANFGTLKKRKLSPEEGRQLALETARLVRDEVTQMRNSIAELEALLHGQQPAITRDVVDSSYHYNADDDEEEEYDEDADDEDESDDGGELLEGERVGEGFSLAEHVRRPPRVVIIRDESSSVERRDATSLMTE